MKYLIVKPSPLSIAISFGPKIFASTSKTKEFPIKGTLDSGDTSREKPKLTTENLTASLSQYKIVLYNTNTT